MTETPTKTVELPLTKTEQRHLANVERRDAKRERASSRRQSIEERDAALKAINDEYGPKIAKLQGERSAKLAKVWDNWRQKRAGGDGT
jgi:vacuolar-type H+-ATPase subunit I/STV1